MAIESVALPKLSLDIIPEARFYIPATGPATRPRRTLKYGDSFIVVDGHGDIGATAGGTDGLFHCDTRFLSRLELQVNGMPPLLLGSNIRDDNSVLSVDLTNPDIYRGGRIVLERDRLHIVRTTFLWQSTAYQRLGVKNHGESAIRIHLVIGFAKDVADVFEVRGRSRKRRATTS